MRTGVVLTVAGLVFSTGCTLFHRAEPPVRVLVLNMHAGKTAAGQSNLDGVAALVKSSGADLVLLQEVDRGTARSGGVDQVAVLQKATGYDAAFGASLLHYGGGEYGIAVLSRGAIGFRSTVPLVVSPRQTRAGGSPEPRIAQLVLAMARRANWRIVNTHLDPSDGQARAQEVAQIVQTVAAQQRLTTGPFVVGGDFNSTPDDPVQRTLKDAGLRDAWAECGQGDGFTYPSDAPAKRIDYLFLTGDLHCSAAQVVETQVSDHRPVLVTLSRSGAGDAPVSSNTKP
jgi:endonuclease/exonuclease/phosphatase family metal-dependent hydrolase